MIDYEEDWMAPLVFRTQGSVAVRASTFAIPATLFTLFLVNGSFWPGFRQMFDIKRACPTQLWVASTTSLALLLGFRTHWAVARFWEATAQLHKMRGEWCDAVSECFVFSRHTLVRSKAVDNPAEPEAKQFRHTLVRLMSLCHGNALTELSCVTMPAIDSNGLGSPTLQHLKRCQETGFNSVEVTLHMIKNLITRNCEDGVLKASPPIQARIHDSLARGFDSLLSAKRIADTRLPFPYAQTIATLLLAHLLVTPMVVSSHVERKWAACLFTYIPIFGMFSINFIGMEMENPFGDGDNDLPLFHFQSEVNNNLLMLLQETSDIVPGTDASRCEYDHDTLLKTIRG